MLRVPVGESGCYMDNRAIGIMLALKSNPILGVIQIREIIGGNSMNVNDKLVILKSYGLLETQYITKPQKRYEISLTSKGQKVAEILDEINSIVAPEKMLSEKSIFERYCDGILITLLRNGTLPITDMSSFVKSYRTLVKLIGIMESEGLVTVVDDTTSYHRKLISLTDHGKDVAKKYKGIAAIIEGE